MRSISMKLCFALCLLSLSALAKIQHDPLLDRAEKLTQTPTGYVIVEDPDVNKYCKDESIDKTNLIIDQETRKTYRASIANRYSTVVNELLEVLNNPQYAGNQDQLVKVGLKIPGAIASIVMLALSILTLALFLVWFIMSLFCRTIKCLFCIKQRQRVLKSKKIFLTIWVLFAIVTFVVSGIWLNKLGSVMKKADLTRCGIAIIRSDLIQGSMLDANTQFIGSQGISYLTTSILSLLDNIQQVQAPAQFIIDQGLSQKGATQSTVWNNFKNGFSPANYNYLGLDQANQVTPASIAAFPTTLVPGKGPLILEVNAIYSGAYIIGSAATAIQQQTGDTLQSTIQSVQDLDSKIITEFQNSINSIYDSLLGGKFDFFGFMDNYGKFILFLALFALIFLNLVFMIIFSMNYLADKLQWCRCINRIILLIQILVVVILFIVSISVNVFNIASATFCTVTDGLLSTDNYVSQLNGRNFISPQVIALSNQCIGPNGSGDTLTALGFTPDTFDDINDILDAMLSYQSLLGELTTNTSPPVMAQIIQQFTNFANLNIPDSTGPSANDVDAGVTAVNQNQCSQDVMHYTGTCPNGYLVSTQGDEPTTGLGSNYCAELGNVPTGNNYEGRYNPGVSCSAGLPPLKETSNSPTPSRLSRPTKHKSKPSSPT
jgi:uncharacterized BrkB/YihY/UPF0761 family membrane protein